MGAFQSTSSHSSSPTSIGDTLQVTDDFDALNDLLPYRVSAGFVTESSSSSATQRPVTIFSADHDNAKACEKLAAFSKAIRSIRHPYIVKYYAFLPSGTAVQLLVDGDAVPVIGALPDMLPPELAYGIYCIGAAIEFLSSKARLSHRSISAAALFTAPDSTWKLAGFESASRITPTDGDAAAATSSQPLCDCRAFRDVLLQLQSTIGSGETIGESLSSVAATIDEQGCCCCSRLGSVLMSSLFVNNPYTRAKLFLDHAAVKSEEERRVFYGALCSTMRQLPRELVARGLTRAMLANRFVFQDPLVQSLVYPDYLHVAERNGRDGGILPRRLFQRYVVPILLQLFQLREAHVLLTLLRFLPGFVEELPLDALRETLVPQLVRATKDADDRLVSASFSALSLLIPLTGADAILGESSVRRNYFSRSSVSLPNGGSGMPIGDERAKPESVESHEHVVASPLSPDVIANAISGNHDDRSVSPPTAESGLERVDDQFDEGADWSDKLTTDNIGSSTPPASIPPAIAQLPTTPPALNVKKATTDREQLERARQAARRSLDARPLGSEFEIRARPSALGGSAADADSVDLDIFAEMQPDMSSLLNRGATLKPHDATLPKVTTSSEIGRTSLAVRDANLPSASVSDAPSAGGGGWDDDDWGDDGWNV